MQNGMPWVRVYTRILEDPKYVALSEGSKLLYMQLIVLAGECDAEGYLVDGDQPMNDEYIARRLHLYTRKVHRELEEIAKSSLIVFENNYISLPKFSELQGRPQSAKREYWSRKQRETRAKSENVNVDTKNVSTLSQAPRVRGEKSREDTHTQGQPLSEIKARPNVTTAPDTPPDFSDISYAKDVELTTAHVTEPTPTHAPSEAPELIPSPGEPALKLFIQLTGYYDLTTKQQLALIERVTPEDIASGVFEKVVTDYTLNHKPKDYGNIGWILTNLERAKQPKPKFVVNGNGGNGRAKQPYNVVAERNRRIVHD